MSSTLSSLKKDMKRLNKRIDCCRGRGQIHSKTNPKASENYPQIIQKPFSKTTIKTFPNNLQTFPKPPLNDLYTGLHNNLSHRISDCADCLLELKQYKKTLQKRFHFVLRSIPFYVWILDENKKDIHLQSVDEKEMAQLLVDVFLEMERTRNEN